MNISNHALDYSSFTDDELEARIGSLDEEIKHLTYQRKRIVETVLNRNADLLNDLLAQKEEPYGVVRINNLEVTFPKKVTYDEVQLARIAEDIKTAGENPSDYIKISYEVSEAKFKAWPEFIKKQFLDARTVKQGNPSVKLKGEKE